MEKIIYKLINEFIQGVDTYTHNGSTWLIFTESKQWVIELTKEKTLWYNYTFFQEIFTYASLNVVEHQQYITKWVEDNIINKVNYTEIGWHQCNNVDDAIERGVKKIKGVPLKTDWSINDTIENGVKETKSDDFNVSQFLCEEVIDKGIIETHREICEYKHTVELIIQTGVKETTALDPSFSVRYINGDFEKCPEVEKIIKNGVKETNHVDVMKFFDNKMEDTLENGMKETKGTPGWTRTENKISNVIDNGVKETFDCDWDVPTDIIEDVINDGIKETKTPGEDGDIVGVTNWMMENNTKNVPKMIDDIIENGVKTELMWIKWDNHLDEIAEKNIKETNSWNESIIGDLNQYGCIDAVIKEGVKETKSIGKESPNYPTPIINHIIINGVKETKGDASQNPMGKVTNVIKEGIKNPTG